MTETNQLVERPPELPDLHPPDGEYFYTEGVKLRAPDGFNRGQGCFVCIEYLERYSCGGHIHAAVQCAVAGRRIASMFETDACSSPELDCRLGVNFVDVIACDKHVRNLTNLCKSTADGVITTRRVQDARHISRDEFHDMVAHESAEIWKYKESERSKRNWYDAWTFCIAELGRIPSPIERRERAERFWRERKDPQAHEDWLEAEKKILAFHTPAP